MIHIHGRLIASMRQAALMNLTKAGKKSDTYEEIAHKLNTIQAAAVRKLNAKWTILSKEQWRFYSGSRLASHVLGLVGYQGDLLAGRYGLERYYNDVLSRDGDNPYTNLFVQIFSATKDALQQKSLEGDIISTIEPQVQATLETELAKIESAWHPDIAGGIVINPQNGEIYAMGVLPNFDPNTFSQEKNSKVFSNPMVEDVYEMGSIIKPITLSIGLDRKVVTPETTYYDAGFLELNGYKISNFDGKSRGTVGIQEILNQSLNTGAVFVERKVGNTIFADYLRKFGIGEETGIDLPSETHGLIENLKSPRDIEYATASFGQGIAMTPIATVRALSVLANGGWLVTPHIVKSVQNAPGVSHRVAPEDRTRVLQAGTSEAISKMLITVYDNALANGTVKIKNYSIAAKTGTAQIANPAGGGYYKDRYLHSFFGYLPGYEAKFLVFFYIVYPKDVQYASETLTHPFVNMAKFLINYYQIPPDR